ncbi:hypothetical protein [Haloferula sp.]|uniref:hypothetical protein n=1 Tax=Haloferula sp. TaxID=2497595 RepID=UPI0032A0D716
MKAIQTILLTIAVTMLFVGNALREQRAHISEQADEVSQQIETIWLSGEFTSEKVRAIYDGLDEIRRSGPQEPWILRHWILISSVCIVLQSVLLLVSLHRDGRKRRKAEQAEDCDASQRPC